MKLMKSSLVVLALAALLATGCAKTQQMRETTTSGFLGDYSQLREGEGDEALMVYVNNGFDFSTIDKVLIEPITILRSEDSELGEVDPADLEALSNYLHATMRETLGKNFEIVEAEGPRTLKLRLAITEAEDSAVGMDTVTNIIPIGLALSGIKKLATGTHSFVGKAGIECEGIDAATGKRVFAAVDRRAGGKRLRGKFSDWNDVRDAYDYWAKRIDEKLMEAKTPAEE